MPENRLGEGGYAEDEWVARGDRLRSAEPVDFPVLTRQELHEQRQFERHHRSACREPVRTLEGYDP